MNLVDDSSATQAVRSALFAGTNDLRALSLEAGALAGLLQLISGSEQLEENQRFALGALADMAQRLENETEAVATRLGDALDGRVADRG